MKSRQRIIDHGEVFTPPGLVNDMLDLVAHECERIDSRFLEPACGDGNFLAEVLRRKLRTVDRLHPRGRDRWERDATIAVCSLYGVDLLADNIAACRARLLGIVGAAHAERWGEALPEPTAGALEYVLSQNLVQGDALSFLRTDGTPIIFPEWSPLNGSLVKRRDFRFDELLENADFKSRPLFNDLGDDYYLPQSVRDYPPCHYLKVADAEGDQ